MMVIYDLCSISTCHFASITSYMINEQLLSFHVHGTLRLTTTWMNSFDMTDLGLLHYLSRCRSLETCSNIFVSQTKYARSLLDRFIMIDCKISSTPMEKGIEAFNQDQL
jgi:hypothetical protein